MSGRVTGDVTLRLGPALELDVPSLPKLKRANIQGLKLPKAQLDELHERLGSDLYQ